MIDNVTPQLAPRAQCTGCSACYNGCPKDAIRMISDSEGFFYPVIGEGCVSCGHCVHICPALKQREERSEPAVFAAWSESETVRSQSTSGGVFYHLAEYVLESGGVVFGAALNEKLQVQHIAVKSPADLPRLLGAKPVQSNIRESYQWVRLYLDQHRKVLFSGTPCQVDGLYRFLGEHPEELITCDVLCQGVASPGVWNRLVEFIAYVKQRFPVAVQFCEKREGERERQFRVTLEGGGDLTMPLSKSDFGRGLRRRLFLRPACHTCSYANTNRPSDLTLGEFHGLPKDFAPAEQGKGISLLLINSVKGAHVFDTLPLHREKRSLSEAVAGNPALQAPPALSPDRKLFFEQLHELPFQKVRSRFLSTTSHQSQKVPSILNTVKEKLWKKH